MSFMKKTLRIAWFGIENHYTLIGIIFLISCFLMPAFTIITIMNSSVSHIAAQSVIKVYGTILSYFEGFALPIGLFSYVHKRRECDFYNSMPVRRSQYFWGYTLTGIIVFMVSFCWMFAAHFVILGFVNIFPCFLPPIAMFLVIYCSMIFAVCFSGSIMSSLVTFALRNCIFISIILLPIIISGVEMNSYFEFFEEKICIFTPVTAIGNWLEQWYGIMLFQILVALAELAAAFFLHKYRKSETTTAIAFPKSRYPFQYTVMLITALLVDALFSGMIFSRIGESDYDFFSSNDFRLFLLLTLIVILISFVFLNIILERSGRAAFSKIRHFFIFTVCYGLVLFTLFNYIAPNLPYEILPFKPEYAVICVNDLTIKKDKIIYDDGYYYYEDDRVYEIAEPAHGDSYVIHASSVIKEAYCISDKEKLSRLVNMVQKKNNREDDFSSYQYSYRQSFPHIDNEQELYSVKMYTVYFMRGNKPYIQEGMSIYNFSNITGSNNCLMRYCFVKDDSIFEQFKETKLNPMGFTTSSYFTFDVYIPYPEDKEPNSSETTQPENSPITSETTRFENSPIPSVTTLFENVPASSETTLFENLPASSETTLFESLPTFSVTTMFESLPIPSETTLFENVPNAITVG